ncbi:hypothetical protein JXO59_02835 [candidate division KSB1 bacterium]|nr:hypothetical protein [candidate division KSB1 bacterium]
MPYHAVGDCALPLMDEKHDEKHPHGKRASLTPDAIQRKANGHVWNFFSIAPEIAPERAMGDGHPS